MYNNDVGKESAQKFMKQTGDLKAATGKIIYNFLHNDKVIIIMIMILTNDEVK